MNYIDKMHALNALYPGKVMLVTADVSFEGVAQSERVGYTNYTVAYSLLLHVNGKEYPLYTSSDGELDKKSLSSVIDIAWMDAFGAGEKNMLELPENVLEAL